MNVLLGEELEAYVREKAREGGYRSVGEVIREAVREQRARDAIPAKGEWPRFAPDRRGR